MLRILCLMLFLPTAALAQSFPAPLSDTVNDYADLLPPEAEARVAQALQAARDETGVHIVLAVIGSQADYGGTGRFADFATAWFNAWGIGDATRNDGVLILVGQNDREMRIALGHAYDVIWDGRAQRVIDTAMLPAFRNGDYAKGLEDGAMLAIDQLARPFAAKIAVTEDSGFPEEPSATLIASLFAGIAAFCTAMWLMGGRLFRGIAARWHACPKCGARRMVFRREVVLKPGETTRGKGQRIGRCKTCGDEHATAYEISSKSEAREAARSSSSSSSGFGGGSSGGGGASGKW